MLLLATASWNIKEKVRSVSGVVVGCGCGPTHVMQSRNRLIKGTQVINFYIKFYRFIFWASPEPKGPSAQHLLFCTSRLGPKKRVIYTWMYFHSWSFQFVSRCTCMYVWYCEAYSTVVLFFLFFFSYFFKSESWLFDVYCVPLNHTYWSHFPRVVDLFLCARYKRHSF